MTWPVALQVSSATFLALVVMVSGGSCRACRRDPAAGPCGARRRSFRASRAATARSRRWARALVRDYSTRRHLFLVLVIALSLVCSDGGQSRCPGGRQDHEDVSHRMAAIDLVSCGGMRHAAIAPLAAQETTPVKPANCQTSQPTPLLPPVEQRGMPPTTVPAADRRSPAERLDFDRSKNGRRRLLHASDRAGRSGLHPQGW